MKLDRAPIAVRVVVMAAAAIVAVAAVTAGAEAIVIAVAAAAAADATTANRAGNHKSKGKSKKAKVKWALSRSISTFAFFLLMIVDAVIRINVRQRLCFLILHPPLTIGFRPYAFLFAFFLLPFYFLTAGVILNVSLSPPRTSSTSYSC